jgi:hypothetical protein
VSPALASGGRHTCFLDILRQRLTQGKLQKARHSARRRKLKETGARVEVV